LNVHWDWRRQAAAVESGVEAALQGVDRSIHLECPIRALVETPNQSPRITIETSAPAVIHNRDRVVYLTCLLLKL
jgi:hypothetical protein